MIETKNWDKKQTLNHHTINTATPCLLDASVWLRWTHVVYRSWQLTISSGWMTSWAFPHILEKTLLLRYCSLQLKQRLRLSVSPLAVTLKSTSPSRAFDVRLHSGSRSLPRLRLVFSLPPVYPLPLSLCSATFFSPHSLSHLPLLSQIPSIFLFCAGLQAETDLFNKAWQAGR